jgi:branched-chain amino acid transport system substrate-binding protein
MRRRILIAAAAVPVLALGACSSSGGSPVDSGGSGGSGDSRAPIQLMLSAGLSAQGTLGVNAKMTEMSVKASIDAVNKSGGVLGHQLQLQVVDDGGDPTTAVTKLQGAINSGKKPFVWMNSGPSNLSAAALPVLKQNNVLSFLQAPAEDSDDPDVYPLNFDMVPATTDSAAAFCPHAKAAGYTKIGILYGDDAYGEPLSASVKKSCEDFGSTVTGVEAFPDDALDVTSQLSKLRSGNPQALVLIGYGAPVGYVFKGLTKLGWDIPVMGDIAVAATDLVVKRPPDGLVGTSGVKNLELEVFQSTVADNAKAPSHTADMIKAIKQQGAIQASLILAYQYDAVQLFAAAATEANTVTDADAIAKALTELGPGDAKTGVFERYYFKTGNHSPNQPADSFAFATPSVLTDGQYQPTS